MNNKTKKLIITLLDVAIGVLIELWASDSFPDLNTLFIILFAIFLLARLVFDWFHETIEEKFFQLELERIENERKGNIEIQKEIKKKMQQAIANGDISQFKKYRKIDKDL